MDTETFADFGLAQPLVDALKRAGFVNPTPIQRHSIAPQLAGRDILGVAQTGTGKTAAFGLPILHQILEMGGRASPKSCRALILAPTRELAVQIEASFRSFAGGARLSTLLILGGMSRNNQIRMMGRGVDIVVATPGRLIDLMDDKAIRLDETRFVVLDEADRMLDMGFIKPVRRIVAALHPRRQSALFSATMPPEVASLAEGFLNDPVRVAVTPQATTIERVEQRVEVIETAAKRGRLALLLKMPDVSRSIVFARTKRGADRVMQNLTKDGIAAEVIHGNKAQNARQKALNRFRTGQVSVLVATDIVARGIDVPGISHIINYDLPDEAENYVHRIGRTARNGADGVAVTLCAPDEIKKLRAVEKVIRTTLLPRVAGYSNVAESKSSQRAQSKAKHKVLATDGSPAERESDQKATSPHAHRARSRRPRKTQRAA